MCILFSKKSPTPFLAVGYWKNSLDDQVGRIYFISIHQRKIVHVLALGATLMFLQILNNCTNVQNYFIGTEKEKKCKCKNTLVTLKKRSKTIFFLFSRKILFNIRHYFLSATTVFIYLKLVNIFILIF